MKTGIWSNNAQEIYKTSKSRTSYQMKKSLESRMRQANERLSELKEAGFGQTQFYQEHKKGFKMPKQKMTRQEMSKKMAEVNRFLNAQSSTVSGMKRARKEELEKLKESKVSGLINEGNLDKFNKFMKYYRERADKQTKIPSDFVATNLFDLSERLKIRPQDIIDNMEEVMSFYHVLEDMSLEDMFPEGKIDRRRRFTVADYLDTVM